MDLTDDEKEIIKFMYEHMCNVANLLDVKLNGYGLTSNDVYHLFEKLQLIDVIYEE